MEDMCLLRPQKRARQELSIQAELKAMKESEQMELLLMKMQMDHLQLKVQIQQLRMDQLQLKVQIKPLQIKLRIGLLQMEEMPVQPISLMEWNELIVSDSRPAQQSIYSFPPKTQSNLEPQTQPQLPQQLVGLDPEDCRRRILLLSATDVIETLLLRFNHYFEKW